MTKQERPSARDAVGMPLPPVPVVEAGARFRNLIGRTHAKMQPPFALVLERLLGLVDNKMLGLLVELDIPDLLYDGPKGAEELARATGTDVDALNRVLRFLVARDVLRTTSDGRYRNGPASDVLRRDHPYSWRGWVEFFASDWNWRIWTSALSSVRRDGNAAETALGMPFFDYLESDRDAGAAFNAAMRSGSLMQGLLVRDAYDFGAVRHVCDAEAAPAPSSSASSVTTPRCAGRSSSFRPSLRRLATICGAKACSSGARWWRATSSRACPREPTCTRSSR